MRPAGRRAGRRARTHACARIDAHPPARASCRAAQPQHRPRPLGWRGTPRHQQPDAVREGSHRKAVLRGQPRGQATNRRGRGRRRDRPLPCREKEVAIEAQWRGLQEIVEEGGNGGPVQILTRGIGRGLRHAAHEHQRGRPGGRCDCLDEEGDHLVVVDAVCRKHRFGATLTQLVSELSAHISVTPVKRPARTRASVLLGRDVEANVRLKVVDEGLQISGDNPCTQLHEGAAY
mmetsp:Transcript_78147/g.243373  ORF Transcript_78147/g.243373 Transcript_78147/m.243373 type:complete len:233 (-) Transcript_78147:129-827(-)